MKFLIFIGLFFSIISCSHQEESTSPTLITTTSAYIMDEARQRVIPIEIYENTTLNYDKGIVIINAGYGCSNTEYSYIAKFLAENNYLVLSTHHEQPTDEQLPSGDSIYQLRLPNWEQGVLNIQSILRYVENNFPNVYAAKINLIGHSNGGDIASLYASMYPEKVATLITLDHRRMPLPRNNNLKILTIRGDEFEADPGVLPSQEEMEKYSIKILQLKNVGHNFLRDNGTEEMKKKINSEIDKLL